MAYNTGSENQAIVILENKQSYDEFVQEYKKYVNFIDFHDKDKRFYAIKNKQGFEILPKSERILFDDEYEIVALDFVIFAYKQLVERYYSLIQTDQINARSQINNFLSRPYMSQVGLDFQPTIDENKIFFNNFVTVNTELNSSSTSIKEYISTYIKNITNFQIPIQTHMRFYNSNRLRNVSGLTITLVNFPFNNDQVKVNFISDPNFPILRKLAEQYGFYIDKNIPWQLTANIFHPNIKSIIKKIYPEEKDITTDFIYKKYFDVILFIDYEKQKEFYYNGYIDLYNFRDQFSEAYYCNKTSETVVRIINREKPPKTLQEFTNLFGEQFFLVSYLKLLNSENNFMYNLIELNKISNKMLSIYQKTLDKKEALVYIYRKFQKPPL